MIESRFAAERAAFRQLKQVVEIDTVLQNDIEAALEALLGRFATAIYENRFVVGGALEVIMVAALRAAGVNTTDVGAQEERLDVRIPNGGFSVKGHFSGSGNVRLINVLGDSEQANWSEVTLFVLHGIGIGYADPDLLGSVGTVWRTRDAIVIRHSVLRTFFRNHPEWFIACRVPQSIQNKTASELVSRAIARQILAQTQKLGKALDTDSV